MNQILLLVGTVILICILTSRFTERLGVPSLLAFIALGMCFGVDGIFKIPFDDYSVSETICSVSLIFIMFYGGFGTNIKEARPVMPQAILLSTMGVLLTAGLVGGFVFLVLKRPVLESLLIGSVIASTDAASVFGILRSKNLNLKDNPASLLEMESGSNDPISYMLTVILTAMMTGQEISVPVMLFQQVFFGLLWGFLAGKGAVCVLNRIRVTMTQGKTILVISVAILAYAIPSIMGGNGYLSVYLCGIIMGNAYLPDKRDLVRFFDVITGVAQMMIFFLLGLLVTPSELPEVFIPSLLIMLFMTIAGRPAAVAALLSFFKASPGQIGVVSWAGLRGVASIVFSIYAVLNQVSMEYNLFNLVFCIVLLSISTQGALLPRISETFHMIDAHADVWKTFNDYQEESSISFIKISVSASHPYADHTFKEIVLPPELLVVLILRGKETIVPNGDTKILPGDLLVAAGKEFEDRKNLTLREITVGKNYKWKGKCLTEIPVPKGTLLVMIERGDTTIIPSGDTVIQEGDVLVEAQF